MTFNCMVQEGLISQAMRAELSKRLTDISRDVFGGIDEDVEVGWIEVPAGSGYTGGKPSTSSLALATVPDGTSQKDRCQALSAICDAWTEVTGCSINEIVATAVDAGLMAKAL